MDWPRNRWIYRLSHLLASLAASVIGVPAYSLAQSSQPAPAIAQFDPSDVYFQGFMAAREAERLERDGDFIGASEKLAKASQLFAAVKKYFPEWKAEVVASRQEKTLESLTNVRAKAKEQLEKNRNQVAELEGGAKSPVRNPTSSEDSTSVPNILQADPLASRRLAEAQAEVHRIKENLRQPEPSPANSSQDASRLRDMTAQRDVLNADLKAAENQVQALRSRLAAAPMELELKALNGKIQQLEQEREAMAMALTQSRSAHTTALSRIDILEADLRVMNQKYADLNRDLKTERKTANSVVSGQRKQLESLQKDLQTKTSELAKANERIQGLMSQLQESNEAFSQLREERNGLLRERDQMAALLKLNEAGRIQELIEQNLSLAKNLREANEKVDRLNRESNEGKDAYIDALRDLAIAKSQINRLHQEKREQQQRLEELESRLKSEETALAEGKASADPAEVEILRDIIKRQLRVQERRRQARDLLIEAARDLGKQDERLAKALELFDSPEVALTPEEQKLVAGSQVDGEFVSPYARDRETVGRATDALKTDIGAFERTAEKSFLAGRLLPTREIYEMILEQHPGHTPSLCKLGVVHLRLNEPAAAVDSFRRAVEMDSQNAYAHRMLALALMKSGDLTAAESSVRKSVDLTPTDAKSHMLLAAICYRRGRTGEAESYFKAAITADPMPSEPYYNLALLNQRAGRVEKAREYYQQALERGATPDPKLEDTLSKP